MMENKRGKPTSDEGATSRTQTAPTFDSTLFQEAASTLYPLGKAGAEDHARGDIIGQRYRVQRVYRGGMGLVYIVENLAGLQQEKSLALALKTFQNRFLWDEEANRRFEREAMQWINLELHPHIVFAFLVERIEGRPYLWLEFVDGESLAERMARRPPGVMETINLALQFSRGMRHAYEKHGLIHRDIKPANCLLTKEGVLKICDFGLSKLRAEMLARGGGSFRYSAVSTQAGVLVGTPAYIPPEAIRNADKADIRGDVYSFGVMLYEMLTGRPLFRGPDVLAQQMKVNPAAPSTINADVPHALDLFVLKCLEKAPERRFASFADVEVELEKIGGQLGGAMPKYERPVSIPEWGREFMKAYTLMEFGKPEEAAAAFRHILESAPREAEVHNNLGLCLAQSGRLGEACESTRRAVDLKPDYAEAWANLGGYLGRRGLFAKGIEACDRAIAVKPRWAEAHANRGANLAGLGRFEEAAACFERALRANPKYWKANIMAAESLARSGGKPEEVLRLVERALEINPKDAEGLAMAAACLNDLGRRSDAERYLGLAEAVGPDSPLVRRVGEVMRKD